MDLVSYRTRLFINTICISNHPTEKARSKNIINFQFRTESRTISKPNVETARIIAADRWENEKPIVKMQIVM